MFCNCEIKETDDAHSVCNNFERKLDMKRLDVKKVEKNNDLLIAIGEDPKRDGLIDTPKRVAK